MQEEMDIDYIYRIHLLQSLIYEFKQLRELEAEQVDEVRTQFQPRAMDPIQSAIGDRPPSILLQLMTRTGADISHNQL